MTSELQDRVLNRLTATGVADEPWALAIVAALDGSNELNAYLDGTKKREMPAPSAASSAAAHAEAPGVYVVSLTVEGFRGIGPAVTLTFPPGPGITLVVGRNGSGKSSFAEGLELLLTGSNYRWADRSKVWQSGWRNLHHGNRVSLKANLVVEGQGTVTISRDWTTDDLDDGKSAVSKPGPALESLRPDTWKQPLVTFRPFLSYNELGSLLEDGPAKLYDALSGVLGLEELVGVQGVLSAARKSRESSIVAAKTGAAELVNLIAALAQKGNDERLNAATAALRWPKVDLPALEALLSGGHPGANAELTLLEQLRSLPLPDVPGILASADDLERAEKACAKFAGSGVERARERAHLLEEAVRYHEKDKDTTCPVCASTNVLSSSWHAGTKAEIASLRKEASAYDAAELNRKNRVSEAQRFLTPTAPVLAQAKNLGLPSLAEARNQWMTWAEGRKLSNAGLLAAHFRTHVAAFAAAVNSLVEDATDEARKRQDLWQPVATRIAEWLPEARLALRAIPRVKELKAAEEWWKDASREIRDERFAPVAGRAMAIWKQLRLQSNVDLGGVELEGAAQRRKVTLRVTVDGAPAEAIGVMSQGELHALALSLFLPRATLPESPFRFIWIDDPVQSMDPARVEGLARTLAETAKTRQVVVFTHDDRLPEAARRLGIPATILAVTRRTNSVVEIRATVDPITGNLDDARALALTKDLRSDVASRVVPGFCRAAIEAACMECVRRRRLGRGETHDAVEDLLANNATPHPLVALALFDDEAQTNGVLHRLNKADRQFADVLQACKLGAHASYDGDLRDLIADTERLARFLLKQG